MWQCLLLQFKSSGRSRSQRSRKPDHQGHPPQIFNTTVRGTVIPCQIKSTKILWNDSSCHTPKNQPFMTFKGRKTSELFTLKDLEGPNGDILPHLLILLIEAGCHLANDPQTRRKQNETRIKMCKLQSTMPSISYDNIPSSWMLASNSSLSRRVRRPDWFKTRVRGTMISPSKTRSLMVTTSLLRPISNQFLAPGSSSRCYTSFAF